MLNRYELVSRLIYGGIAKTLSETNKIINKSIESGFYEDEKVLIMAVEKREGTYCKIYEFDLEWKNR